MRVAVEEIEGLVNVVSSSISFWKWSASMRAQMLQSCCKR